MKYQSTDGAAIGCRIGGTTDQTAANLYVPRHVQIHILEEPDELADFFSGIHIREMTEASVFKITDMLQLMGSPVTVVSEEGYADRIFQDAYFLYFSKKYSRVSQDCIRLSFFQGALHPDTFQKYDAESERFLQSRFVGICVLKPIQSGEVGLTVISPGKLRLSPCLLRTAKFSYNILGHMLYTEGYPYSSQDAETMSCAEVTVWSILEYFGTRFPQYRTALPSEILREIELDNAERVLPTRGLEYSSISRLFKAFGFSPRLYDRKAYEGSPELNRQFETIFHYYVESGIPLAVGISGKKRGEEVKHSIVCIGHGSRMRKLSSLPIQYLGREPIYPYIDAADLYENYVLMDDNRCPYQVESFQALGGWDSSAVSTFAVPLFRDIYLEAGEVSAIVQTVFASENLGISPLIPQIGETVDQNNPLVLRIFLASSSVYQHYRAKDASSTAVAAFYSALRLPEYVWVTEIATFQQYQGRKICGEILIDAKSSRTSYLDSLILVRYLDHLGFREPEEDAVRAIDAGLKHRTEGLLWPFTMYEGNLEACGKEDAL